MAAAAAAAAVALAMPDGGAACPNNHPFPVPKPLSSSPPPFLLFPPKTHTLKRHWALALPLWLVLAVAYVYWAYEGLNALGVPPLDAPRSLHDAACKWRPGAAAPFAAAAAAAGSGGGKGGGGGGRRGSGGGVPRLAHIAPAVASRVLYGGERPAGESRRRAVVTPPPPPPSSL